MSALPGVTTGLFETEVRVENRIDETLYITPITTTYAEPRIITQPGRLRQVDIPLQPGGDIVLSYDAANFPLSEIAVCREDDDCRVLTNDYSDVMVLDLFDALPELESSWLQAMQTSTRHIQGTSSPLGHFVNNNISLLKH